jgi:hypothetical protein
MTYYNDEKIMILGLLGAVDTQFVLNKKPRCDFSQRGFEVSNSFRRR